MYSDPKRKNQVEADRERLDVRAKKDARRIRIYPSEALPDELYRRAIEKYGIDHQMVVAVEELSELQKELCKYNRGMASLKHIAEEVSDVEIMLEQIKRYFSLQEAVEVYKKGKLKRLEDRLDEQGGKNQENP